MKLKIWTYVLLAVVFYNCNNTIKKDEVKNKNLTSIRLNQVGYPINGEKIAIYIGTATGDFQLTNQENDEVVFSGKIKESIIDFASKDTTCIIDFSEFKTPGKYRINIPSIGSSYSFSINDEVYSDLIQASIKAFYFQRISMPIVKEFGGKWARPAGHPDDSIIVHPCAVSSKHPKGSTVSSPGGWYDAGDYNKYIVNSGITVSNLLSVYEEYPEFCKSMNLNIPESNNQIPDILDEIIYNLRWMLTMQDNTDGGVFHKVTNASFDGMDLPHKCTKPRYLIHKTTTATLNLAVVTAQASRVFSDFSEQLPGLADSCLQASLLAWKWAKKNPTVYYNQNKTNETYDPDIQTGAYDDTVAVDEFIWAATELFVTTKEAQFKNEINTNADTLFELQDWRHSLALAYYTMLRNPEAMASLSEEQQKKITETIVEFADELLQCQGQNGYNCPMFNSDKYFIWGSNSEAANQSIILTQAFKITKDTKYLNQAFANYDYLLGRNATGYCFLTGFGSKQPMNPHHRLFAGDEFPEPTPGFLVGGPNKGKSDKKYVSGYLSDIPSKSYLDELTSYASNEIAINWNAAFVYMSVALQNEHKKK